MYRKLTTGSVVIAFVLTGCLAPVVAQIEDDLAKTAAASLSSKDPGELLSKSLFLFYRNFGDSRLNDLARAVWHVDRHKYPDLSWELLEEPEFRIPFAQLWAQWARRVHRDEIQVQQIRSYVEPFLSSGNPHRQSAAVNFVAVLGDESDIFVLKQIALEERPTVAMNAILAIAKIGGPRAQVALQELEMAIQTPSLKRKVSELTPQK